MSVLVLVLAQALAQVLVLARVLVLVQVLVIPTLLQLQRKSLPPPQQNIMLHWVRHGISATSAASFLLTQKSAS